LLIYSYFFAFQIILEEANEVEEEEEDIEALRAEMNKSLVKKSKKSSGSLLTKKEPVSKGKTATSKKK
jgi:hypothetical protein